MNINSVRAEQRSRKITHILNTIKNVFSQGLDLDYKKLINEVCYSQRVSRRTATEYLDVALSQVEHTIETICRKKWIVQKKESSAISGEEDNNPSEVRDVAQS